MKIFSVIAQLVAIFASFLLISGSCGKTSTPTPPNPCSGVTVAVTATTVSPTTIGGTNGSITATATGGSGFTYNINGGAFQASGSFTGLAAGTYTVIAKNSNGCTGSGSFTVSGAPNPCAGVIINVTAVTTNPTTVGGANGSIVASATGSTGLTFNINGGAFQPNGIFNNLAAGAYIIIAKDANGCTGTATFTLVNPNPCAGVTINVTATTTNPTTVGGTNGSIAAIGTGSTGFTFNINGGAFQATGIFNNLAAGTYTIVAKDANGCTGSNAFTLTNPDPCAGVNITVNNTTTNNTPCEPNNGSISATATGGAASYTFSLNGGAFQTSNIFGSLGPGNYTITAKDANGCTGTSGSIAVSNLPAGALFSAVRTVLQNNCVGCHNNSQAEGGMNWTVDCNIVTFKERIKARAVDANPSVMPPTGALSTSDKQKITDWINAGGRFSN
ncbi:hypothetical protein CAP36_04035 [Chitinophagaceae bacterium IBVUCB2]|nr:hypothetical protein CAP36_04035 [Chitinophagaceae bacterium IBVUCB2]